MMTNKRQITEYDLHTSRHDRQFHPYRRPAGYVRFASVPPMSAERQCLMTFMVVSRRGVTGTCPDALRALGAWSQEEATCRILSRFTYYYLVRRDRRYHPYKRPRKHSSRQCRGTSLPLYPNYIHFPTPVERHLNETAAISVAGNEMEVETLSRNNSTVDPEMAHKAQAAMLKPLDTTTPELDKTTSVDVTQSDETDTKVEISPTDLAMNLLTDSDHQEMREQKWETNVKDLSSPAESKITTDLATTCFDNIQCNNVFFGDDSTTSDVPRLEAQVLQEVSDPEQVNISAQGTETAGSSETDMNQLEREEIDNEYDLLQIDRSVDDPNESVLGMSESLINVLLDIEKTGDVGCRSKQSIIDEKQVNSNKSLSTSEPKVTENLGERTREQEVNAELRIESNITIWDGHKDRPETNFTPGKTREESSDEIATVTDIHDIKSEKENVALKKTSIESEVEIATFTDIHDMKPEKDSLALKKTRIDSEVESDDSNSCDRKICLSKENLQTNIIKSLANSDMKTTVSASAKASVKIANTPEQIPSDCGNNAENNRSIPDKIKNPETDNKTLESDTISTTLHNKPKVPRIMYVNPAMIAQLMTPNKVPEKNPNISSTKGNSSTKQITTSVYISSKQTTSECCKEITEEKQQKDELHKTRDTADSTHRRIISLNPRKTIMSAADFFQKEMKSQSDTSKLPVCSDGKTASSSTRRVICLRPDKNKNLKSTSPKITNQIKAKDREDRDLHSNDTLSMWIRKSTSLSDPNKYKQKLSDEERLQLRKRRFETASSNQQTDNGPSVVNKRRIIRLKRH